MNQRATSGHEDWLLNLAHQKLTDDEILKGFIKYYALSGYVIDDVADDMLFKMNCNPTEIKKRLIEALEKAADGSIRNEMAEMELQEVLEKLRRADKVTVRDGPETLFCGGVNQCVFEKNLISREVDGFYPETLGGLIVNLK